MRHSISSLIPSFVKSTGGAVATIALSGAAVVTAASAGLGAHGQADANATTPEANPSALPTVATPNVPKLAQLFAIPGGGTVTVGVDDQGSLVVTGITAVDGVTASVSQQTSGTVSVTFAGADKVFTAVLAKGDRIVAMTTHTLAEAQQKASEVADRVTPEPATVDAHVEVDANVSVNLD